MDANVSSKKCSFSFLVSSKKCIFAKKEYIKNKVKAMETKKVTREEAIRRWNAAKEGKRNLMAKLETLVRKSYKERTGKEPLIIETW